MTVDWNAKTPQATETETAAARTGKGSDAFVLPEGLRETAAEYRVLQLGVYNMILAHPPDLLKRLPGKLAWDRVRQAPETIPLLRRFLAEIFALGPLLLVLLFVADSLASVMPTVERYLTNQLLSTIETGVVSKTMDRQAIMRLGIYRLIVVVATSSIGIASCRLTLVLKHRARLHFEFMAMKAKLHRQYMSKSGDDEESPSSSRTDINAWDTFKELHDFIQSFMATFTEIAFVVQLARSNHINISVYILGFIRVFPIFEGARDSMYTRAYIYFSTNESFISMLAFKQMANFGHYRQEIVTGNLVDYILDGILAARKRLGDTKIGHPYELIKDDPLWEVVSSLIDDWPTVYYAASAVMTGSIPCSFTTISSLQSATWSIQWKMRHLFGNDTSSMTQMLITIKEFYASIDFHADDSSSLITYPAEPETPGMDIEFRDVVFSYPSTKSKEPAVKHVSFSIKPGQLVVIVGANGSGKTSLVKLLTGLYKPTTGAILVDGQPSDTYHLHDLREATAFLSQDHNLFPLSVAENIALGRPRKTLDMDAVRSAAKKGGADGFIAKLTDGYDTHLYPMHTKCSSNLQPKTPLQKVYEKLEKSAEVSGGQSQRLVAARTFMRIDSGGIKLVVVDEPSASMDPAGEYELFKELRAAREGKTMIFITHRFGHLTKHADVILCMKEGELVECGTHEELAAKKGEYYNLYHVQAQAFTD